MRNKKIDTGGFLLTQAGGDYWFFLKFVSKIDDANLFFTSGNPIPINILTNETYPQQPALRFPMLRVIIFTLYSIVHLRIVIYTHKRIAKAQSPVVETFDSV